jgi:hypothetical protein
VQIRLLRQRAVMAVQKAQADVLLHRLHCALRAARLGKRAREARYAQGEFHEAVQPRREWADTHQHLHGDFDADRGFGFGFDGVGCVGRPAH